MRGPPFGQLLTGSAGGGRTGRHQSAEPGSRLGLLSTAQQLGGAVGLSALISVAAARFDNQTSAGVSVAQASVSSFHLVFSISAVMLLAAATLSLRLPALRQKTDLADMVH
jgi:hypothetical protein